MVRNFEELGECSSKTESQSLSCMRKISCTTYFVQKSRYLVRLYVEHLTHALPLKNLYSSPYRKFRYESRITMQSAPPPPPFPPLPPPPKKNHFYIVMSRTWRKNTENKNKQTNATLCFKDFQTSNVWRQNNSCSHERGARSRSENNRQE